MKTPHGTLCVVLLRFREEFNLEFVFLNFKNSIKDLEKAKKSTIKKDWSTVFGEAQQGSTCLTDSKIKMRRAFTELNNICILKTRGAKVLLNLIEGEPHIPKPTGIN